MPELPEVETIRRDLSAAVEGRRIIAAATGHPSVFRFPSPEAVVAGIVGSTVVTVGRRGKYLVISLDSGDDLVVHLGMTGHLLVCETTATPALHTHLRATLDDGRELRFDDARRFGRIILGEQANLRAIGALPRLGVEPLSGDFTVEHVAGQLRRTTRTVKAALLDQSVIAGLGNIYVDEACHLAGVRPTRRCHRLRATERVALHQAIPAVLTKAIGNRGTSFDDYRDVWNAKGSNQETLQVYGRAGEPCLRCGVVLRRTVLGGRTTVFCSGCQR